MKEELNIIFTSEPFSKLKDELKEVLKQHLKIFSFQKDSILIKKGEFGSVVFFLLEGECGVFTGESDKNLVAKLSPPDFFGEMSLLANIPRTATVKALTDIKVASINFQKFKEILYSSAEIVTSMDEFFKKRKSELAIAERKMQERIRKKESFLDKIKKIFKK